MPRARSRRDPGDDTDRHVPGVPSTTPRRLRHLWRCGIRRLPRPSRRRDGGGAVAFRCHIPHVTPRAAPVNLPTPGAAHSQRPPCVMKPGVSMRRESAWRTSKMFQAAIPEVTRQVDEVVAAMRKARSDGQEAVELLHSVGARGVADEIGADEPYARSSPAGRGYAVVIEGIRPSCRTCLGATNRSATATGQSLCTCGRRQAE